MVEIFKNAEDERDVMIRSNCEDEKAFTDEFSRAFSQFVKTETAANGTVTSKLMGLFTDICCKYRGYKAEGVTEKKVYVAGQGVPFGPAAYAVSEEDVYVAPQGEVS